ncbi:MAG: spore coat U domain-containing protein [Hyphomonas sp.]
MIRKLMAVAALAACGQGAYAATATGTLDVQATVVNTCVVLTTPVVFAGVGLDEVTANGSITVNCTNTSAFTVALDGGDSGNISARTLTHASLPASFNYQLYTDAGLTTVWGDGVTGSQADGAGPSQTLTVYGRTTSTPDTAGAYSDEVQVTVTY